MARATDPSGSGAIPEVPYVVTEWRREHPDEQMPDGLILTQPWPVGPADKRRDQVIYYQYKTDRARRTLRGIDAQAGKAEKAVAGKVPVKRNRFIKLVGANKSVNRAQEARRVGWPGSRATSPTCPSRARSS